MRESTFRWSYLAEILDIPPNLRTLVPQNEIVPCTYQGFVYWESLRNMLIYQLENRKLSIEQRKKWKHI